MAEVIGVAASGIALAGVAGKIITTSLAIKRLMDDVAELPERFTLLLDQIAVLTPVLVEASSDATGTSTAPSPLDKALGAAAAQCSKALDQLNSLASELSEQIAQSRGFKRRLIAVKIALRKDVLVKHEKRLDNAVQLLLIAQQTCILSFQRMQPGLLASLILDELEARKQSSSSSLTCQELTVEHTNPHPLVPRHTTRARTGNKGGNVVETRRAIRLGLPEVTGLIEIQMPVSANRAQKTQQPKEATDGERFLFGLKIQLPSWLSSRILDSALYQTQAGWTHGLRTYNTFRGTYGTEYHEGTPFGMVKNALRRDDLVRLRELFENRVLTPFDKFVCYVYVPENLLDLALRYHAWTICNYLIAKGVRPDIPSISLLKIQDNTEETTHQLTLFLQNDEIDDKRRLYVLRNLTLPLSAFTDLRRLICIDEDFTADWNRPRRLELINFVITYGYGIPSLTAEIAGSMIFNDPDILRTQSGTILRTILRGITSGMRMGDPIEYSILIKAILLRCSAFCEDQFMRMVPDCLHGTLEHLLREWVTYYHDDDFFTFSDKLAEVEFTLHTWLQTLENAGIDLELYGEREKRLIPTYMGKHGVALSFTHRRGKYEPTIRVRLIGIQYGPRARDWRLWWTEPTDAFVGDFWRGIERKVPPLLMPGSWIEVDEYESESEEAPRLFLCPRVQEDTAMPHQKPQAAPRGPLDFGSAK